MKGITERQTFVQTDLTIILVVYGVTNMRCVDLDSTSKFNGSIEIKIKNVM